VQVNNLSLFFVNSSIQYYLGESYNIECPNNYGVVIIRNLFGVTSSDQCEIYDATKHCVSTAVPLFFCPQGCTYMYTGNRIISSCNNKNAVYQYVEYQCIPTQTSLFPSNTTCVNDGTTTTISVDRNGRFRSANYPNLVQMNCRHRLQTKTGYIMHIYALDISLNSLDPNCGLNKMTLQEYNEEQGLDFCEQRTYSLIYSTCSNEIDLRYTINDDKQYFFNGIELYIESQPRPSVWSCGDFLSTSTIPTTNRLTPVTPQATSITSNSLMSVLNPVEYDICYNEVLNHVCPYGYTLMIIDSYYGVKNQTSNQCGFVRGDCIQQSTITQCQNDSPNCYLPYSIKRRLAFCSDKYADYLHITYQCVPSFPVGPTSTLQVFDICETYDPISDFNGVVISPAFPDFNQTDNECRREIVGVQDKVLKIWINEMDLSSGGQRNSDGKRFLY
jgi:hypothetical protein